MLTLAFNSKHRYCHLAPYQQEHYCKHFLTALHPVLFAFSFNNLGKQQCLQTGPSMDYNSIKVPCVYLAEGFPGVSVSSAKTHYHVHSKTPHHVVLQIPVSRQKHVEKKTIILTQSYQYCALPPPQA